MPARLRQGCRDLRQKADNLSVARQVSRPVFVKERKIYPVHHHSVRMKGLEPPRLSTPDPKSGAATNYATSAKRGAKIQKN